MGYGKSDPDRRDHRHARLHSRSRHRVPLMKHPKGDKKDTQGEASIPTSVRPDHRLPPPEKAFEAFLLTCRGYHAPL
jgi:hypothetical protein